jgi:hypothetical protein
VPERVAQTVGADPTNAHGGGAGEGVLGQDVQAASVEPPGPQSASGGEDTGEGVPKQDALSAGAESTDARGDDASEGVLWQSAQSTGFELQDDAPEDGSDAPGGGSDALEEGSELGDTSEDGDGSEGAEESAGSERWSHLQVAGSGDKIRRAAARRLAEYKSGARPSTMKQLCRASVVSVFGIYSEDECQDGFSVSSDGEGSEDGRESPQSDAPSPAPPSA